MFLKKKGVWPLANQQKNWDLSKKPENLGGNPKTPMKNPEILGKVSKNQQIGNILSLTIDTQNFGEISPIFLKIFIIVYGSSHYWLKQVTIGIFKMGTVISHGFETVCFLSWF